MKNTHTSFPKKAARLFCTLTCTAAFASSLMAKPVPSNLGYGLDKLVESNIALRATPEKGKAAPLGRFSGYATEEAASYAESAVKEESSGRFMVDITLRGNISFEQVSADVASKTPSLTIIATDSKYRGAGIIEGLVSVEDVAALANIPGVRSVFLVLKPERDSLTPSDETLSPSKAVPSLRKLVEARAKASPDVVPGQLLTKLGTAFDQGVTQHRVDKINQTYNPSATSNWDGTGISIGAMSDSFNTRGTAPTAASGVATRDLPGAGNPVNTQPVVVLQDDPAAGSDEGRAMVEILHKMAPKARLAFGTGVIGEVAFANMIKALAGVPGFTFPAGTQQGFKADVICDDISYGGEPFYGETIIGNAIDEVTALGVSYFSSAGNNIGINAYESALRIVPNGTGLTAAAGNTALANTNINLTGVPTNLYAGGFHNFNPNPGQQDVAGLWNMPTGSPGATEMQWDDPYDIRDPILNQPPIYSNSGTINSATPITYTDIPPFVQGTGYVINVIATSGDFDAIVTLTDPSGNNVVVQDTGTDETVFYYAPVSGQYKITVSRFASTTGNFTITINTTQTPGSVTTDYNLLVFRADNGAYLSTRSLTTDNVASNRPVELGGNSTVNSPAGQTQIQFLIARRNIPPANVQQPTRIRISTRGNGLGGIGPAEYFSYNAVTTKGHATAAGCNGTAAYSPFRANLPEGFTSPGPATIIFDKNANRLATPIVRLSPTIAAINRANNSFFAGDSTSDPDTNPEFSGTSAAAPHAAALAALVLHAHGGPTTVSPAQMRSVLQRSAYTHDLDPSAASGVARATNGGKITFTVNSDNDSNTSTGLNDPNSMSISYIGPGAISSIVFNPAGLATEGGNVTGGNNGVVDSNPQTTPPTVVYFDNRYPGLAFEPTAKAFTLGNSTGLTAGDVVQPTLTPLVGFSNPSPLPAPQSPQIAFRTMTLNFPTGNFTGGKILRFTVGRGAEHSSAVGNGAAFDPGPTGGTTTVNPIADLFGGGVFIPDGTVVNDGMKFSGTLTDGSTFTGTIKNRLGAGYSPVDGYGVINIESAVTLPLQ